MLVDTFSRVGVKGIKQSRVMNNMVSGMTMYPLAKFSLLKRDNTAAGTNTVGSGIMDTQTQDVGGHSSNSNKAWLHHTTNPLVNCNLSLSIKCTDITKFETYTLSVIKVTDVRQFNLNNTGNSGNIENMLCVDVKDLMTKNNSNLNEVIRFNVKFPIIGCKYYKDGFLQRFQINLIQKSDYDVITNMFVNAGVEVKNIGVTQQQKIENSTNSESFNSQIQYRFPQSQTIGGDANDISDYNSHNLDINKRIIEDQVKKYLVSNSAAASQSSVQNYGDEMESLQEERQVSFISSLKNGPTFTEATGNRKQPLLNNSNLLQNDNPFSPMTKLQLDVFKNQVDKQRLKSFLKLEINTQLCIFQTLSEDEQLQRLEEIPSINKITIFSKLPIESQTILFHRLTNSTRDHLLNNLSADNNFILLLNTQLEEENEELQNAKVNDSLALLIKTKYGINKEYIKYKIKQKSFMDGVHDLSKYLTELANKEND